MSNIFYICICMDTFDVLAVVEDEDEDEDDDDDDEDSDYGDE